MARRYKQNPCVMNPGRKNPWYVVRRPHLEVSSGFPHFTEKSSTDEVRDMERHAQAHGRPAYYEGIYTDKAVEPGDMLARDGRVVKRKDLGLTNPFMKGKMNMWYPAKGSEAAKDLGGLLQKMRKATPEEKEKLKVLYKKTREKWMAREPKPKKNPYYVVDETGDMPSAAPHEDIKTAQSEAAKLQSWHPKKKYSVLYHDPESRGNPLAEAIVSGIAGGATMSLLNRSNPWYVMDRKSGEILLRDIPGGDSDDTFAQHAAAQYAADNDCDMDDLQVGYAFRPLRGKKFPQSGQYHDLQNPYYVTDKDFTVVGKGHKSRGKAHESKSSFDFFAKTVGRHHGGSQKYGHPFHVIETPKEKKEGEYVFDNPHLVIVGNPPPNGIALPKSLERQVLRAPAKDRPELLKGIEKYHEFHGCFPKKIVQRDVDHAKVGLPLVNVGLGWSDNVEYRSTNASSNKFFAGGKGKYVHKFGDELPKAERKGAKPLLVTDPTGKTLHYLPSKFKVKDWIHH